MDGMTRDSSLVPSLVLEYASFSHNQGATKPLVMSGPRSRQ